MKESLLLCNNYDFSYELYANLLIHEKFLSRLTNENYLQTCQIRGTTV